jgi:hypothetical protein
VRKAPWPVNTRRRALIAMVAIVCGVALWAGVWQELNSPGLFCYGPFTGATRQEMPAGPPDQRFPIYGGYVLSVFDPREEESAPTVALADSEGRVRWCIYATHRNRTVVSRIRFQGTARFPFRCPRVIGGADWGGNGPGETTLWMIGWDGRLVGYWYYY